MAEPRAAVMDQLLRPADWVRLRMFHALGSVGSRLAGDLDLRVAAVGCLGVAAAFLLASSVPMWMLALGPIVLGVPHVLADVRYLVVRRGYHRRKWLVVLAFAPLVAAAFGGGLLAGLIAAGGALLCARTTAMRRVIGLTVVALLGSLVVQYGYYADVVFAHAHNFLAVLLWWLWKPRKLMHAGPLLLFLVCSVALMLGWSEGILTATNGLFAPATGLDMYRLSFGLAPNLPLVWVGRLIVLFAFAQSIHYLVWLRLVPEEDRGRPTPRTFRASWQALVTDLGRPLLVLAGLAALAVAVWATIDLAEAREGYLKMALFHADLELVALALFFAEGRPGEAASDAATES
jgi:hypothetical protein